MSALAFKKNYIGWPRLFSDGQQEFIHFISTLNGIIVYCRINFEELPSVYESELNLLPFNAKIEKKKKGLNSIGSLFSWIQIIILHREHQPGSIIRSASAVSPCISPLIICCRQEIYLEYGLEPNLAGRV